MGRASDARREVAWVPTRRPARARSAAWPKVWKADSRRAAGGYWTCPHETRAPRNPGASPGPKPARAPHNPELPELPGLDDPGSLAATLYRRFVAEGDSGARALERIAAILGR